MKIRFVMLLSAVALTAACGGGPDPAPSTPNATGFSQAVADVVATCSAGASITTTAQARLTVELTKILEGSGAAGFEGKVESAIKGIAFADKDLTNANVVEAMRLYTSCVNTSLPALKQ